MTEAVDPSEAIRMVGADRHPTAHLARMRDRTVYILHSQSCVDIRSDLRTCPHSIALDKSITEGVGGEDWQAAAGHPSVAGTRRGYLVPIAPHEPEPWENHDDPPGTLFVANVSNDDPNEWSGSMGPFPSRRAAWDGLESVLNGGSGDVHPITPPTLVLEALPRGGADRALLDAVLHVHRMAPTPSWPQCGSEYVHEPHGVPLPGGVEIRCSGVCGCSLYGFHSHADHK